MTAEIITLDVETRLDVPVERIFKGAQESGVDPVVVIGREPNGEFYLATSIADLGHILLLLERARELLLRSNIEKEGE